MVDRAKLEEAFPPDNIKQRPGARGVMLSYVPAHAVIQRLNAACGDAGWSFTVLRLDREGLEKTKDGKVVSFERYTAHVELTLPGLGSRQQLGVQNIDAGSGEDMVKGAITDGLKKCASLFGVALALYEDAPQHQPRQAAEQPAQKTRAAWEMTRDGAGAPCAAPSQTPDTRKVSRYQDPRDEY